MHLYASERLAGNRCGLKQYSRLMRGAGREPCSERMFLHVEALADFSYFNRKREPDSLRRPARQFPRAQQLLCRWEVKARVPRPWCGKAFEPFRRGRIIDARMSAMSGAVRRISSPIRRVLNASLQRVSASMPADTG